MLGASATARQPWSPTTGERQAPTCCPAWLPPIDPPGLHCLGLAATVPACWTGPSAVQRLLSTGFPGH